MILDNRFIRQQDAVDMRKLSTLKVTLIGAGSIGSTTAVWLGKMGIT
jgi:tRNA A37 threonylcarbamoyladenosine dehydratase